MLDAGRTCETLVYFNKAIWRYIPEGCNFHVKIGFEIMAYA
jgi:hypothetical protein